MSIHKVTTRSAGGPVQTRFELRCDRCPASGGTFAWQPAIGAVVEQIRAGWGIEGRAGVIVTAICPQCMAKKAREGRA